MNRIGQDTDFFSQRRNPHLGPVHAVQAVPEADEPESPETHPP